VYFNLRTSAQWRDFVITSDSDSSFYRRVAGQCGDRPQDVCRSPGHRPSLSEGTMGAQKVRKPQSVALDRLSMVTH
jgi:hypothetical protein